MTQRHAASTHFRENGADRLSHAGLPQASTCRNTGYVKRHRRRPPGLDLRLDLGTYPAGVGAVSNGRKVLPPWLWPEELRVWDLPCTSLWATLSSLAERLVPLPRHVGPELLF